MDKIIKSTSWSNLSYSDVQRELTALRSSDRYDVKHEAKQNTQLDLLKRFQ